MVINISDKPNTVNAVVEEVRSVQVGDYLITHNLDGLNMLYTGSDTAQFQLNEKKEMKIIQNTVKCSQ